jgi:GMP synthase (glutamine-hydrolysing)
MHAPLIPQGPTAAARRPVLLVLHQELSIPGRVGNYLTRMGVPLDIRRPRFGDPLPETLDAHAGAVIFGGPQSANDTDDFIRREIDWIAVPLAEKRPFLGICLGAQMMARHLGARVAYHAEGKAEVGYYPIRVSDAARKVCGDWPDVVYQWHREGFELPHGAELLAEGEIFPVQAMRYGTCFALQFHAEVTHAMMCRWTTRGHARMEMPGANQRAAHFAERPVYDLAIRTWLMTFLEAWLKLGQGAAARAAIAS